MKWLTIDINPPKLDVDIVVRTADEYGYGATYTTIKFDSRTFTEDEAVQHLNNYSYIEWLELPE